MSYECSCLVEISVFGAVAIVFAVQGVNQGLFSVGGASNSAGALNAMAAGWLLLALVDVSPVLL